MQILYSVCIMSYSISVQQSVWRRWFAGIALQCTVAISSISTLLRVAPTGPPPLERAANCANVIFRPNPTFVLQEKRDLVTGLKSRTNAGRPNWNKVFTKIKEQRKGKVTVFFCGNSSLGRILKLKCDEFGFTFKKEIF